MNELDRALVQLEKASDDPHITIVQRRQNIALEAIVQSLLYLMEQAL